MKKAKHLAEEYGEKAVNKVKSVRDEGKRPQHFEAFVQMVRFIYCMLFPRTTSKNVLIRRLVSFDKCK